MAPYLTTSGAISNHRLHANGAGGPLAVGVFVNASVEEMNGVADRVGLDLIQLHGVSGAGTRTLCYSTMHRAVKHRAVKHRDVKHRAVKHRAVKHRTAKHGAVKHGDVKHRDVKHRDVKPHWLCGVASRIMCCVFTGLVVCPHGSCGVFSRVMWCVFTGHVVCPPHSPPRGRTRDGRLPRSSTAQRFVSSTWSQEWSHSRQATPPKVVW